MPKRVTCDEFLYRAIIRHGDRFGYSKLKFINMSTHVDIICNRCGNTMLQTPTSHLRRGGCIECSRRGRIKTKEQFIIDANLLHNNMYEYTLVDYVAYDIVVIITCKTHGNFPQTPTCHLQGCGCPECGRLTSLVSHSDTYDDFLAKAVETHGDLYGYLLVKYTNSITEVDILCHRCNTVFKQMPRNHIFGAGCRDCNVKEHIESLTKQQDEFIRDAINKHGNLFGYSLVKYINNSVKIDIICNKCKAIFPQEPHAHLQGNGCPFCRSSKGERSIKLYLDYNNIIHESQKMYSECRSLKNRMLKFDFFIPSHNLLIEFDGQQHFKPVFMANRMMTDDEFNTVKLHDSIKNEYASKNNIKLLRIPYWDKNKIPEILNEHIIS